MIRPSEIGHTYCIGFRGGPQLTKLTVPVVFHRRASLICAKNQPETKKQKSGRQFKDLFKISQCAALAFFRHTLLRFPGIHKRMSSPDRPCPAKKIECIQHILRYYIKMA